MLVFYIANLCNMFLAQYERLEASSTLFHYFIEQDLVDLIVDI